MNANNPPANAQRSKNTIKAIRRIQQRVDQLITNLADDFNNDTLEHCARPAAAAAATLIIRTDNVRQLIDRVELWQCTQLTSPSERRQKTRTIYIGTPKDAAATIAAMLEQTAERQGTLRLSSESDTDSLEETGESESDSGSDSSSTILLNESRAQLGRLMCNTHAKTWCLDHMPGQRFMHGSLLCTSPTAV